MGLGDIWFHDDENVAGAQSKEDNLKAVKRSRLRDLVGKYTAPLARPSAYELRKLISKKALEREQAIEKKKKEKPSLREKIALESK